MLCKPRGPKSHNELKAKKRKFFDLWGSHESQEFTLELISELGFRAEVEAARREGNDNYLPYRVFSSLPDPDLSSKDAIPFNLIQARALFEKSSDWVAPGVDREGVAYAKFLKTEETCAATNLFFAERHFTASQASILAHAQGWIAKVLGNCPTWDEIDLSFSSGATTGTSNNQTTARWKLSPNTTLSGRLLSVVPKLRDLCPWLSDAVFQPTCGALDFVEKNWKTYRSIILTGTVNAILQKGYGTRIKKRLKIFGVNLYDQSINRNLAREGSITGKWATVDLSSASDTISSMLVLELLPFEWFCALDLLRDTHVTYKGKVIELSKFSAMGNGYTFELESLIFRALVHGINMTFALDDECSVYGDDIICRPSTAQLIAEFFPQFGFSLNVEKTFTEGAFRESCGADFISGVFVRPYFLRGTRTKGRWTYASMFTFYNHLMRHPQFDPDRHLRDFLLQKIPKDYHRFGPEGYGDGWLVSNAPLHTYAMPYGRDKGFEGFTLLSYQAKPFRDRNESLGDPYYPFYCAGKQGNEVVDHFVVRAPKGARMKERSCKVYVV